ncbi:MAG: hypothetical protein LBE91_12000, partial [Tannerella sp.]|nr:hypothetical protein [Tannerella sp.]
MSVKSQLKTITVLVAICVTLLFGSYSLLGQRIITDGAIGTEITSAQIIGETNGKLTEYGIADLFVQQLEAFPQEKLHLHTDRNMYVPGEKIWFKAYVVDAHTHLYPTYSQYVYVELISPADTLVHRVMVKQTDEMFYGNLPITEAIPEGDYTLRAYTRFMENMGDDYFFKKNIRVGSIKGIAGQSRNDASRQKLYSQTSKENEILSLTGNKDQQDFDVSFFP